MSHGGMLALGYAAPSPVQQTSGAFGLPGAATASDGGRFSPHSIVLAVFRPGVMDADRSSLLCPNDVSQFMPLTSPISALQPVLQPFPHCLHRSAFQSLNS